MLHFIKWLLFIVSGLAVVPSHVHAAETFAWLALGDYRSHFEPCGCDPESDLGGVRRLSNFLVKERAINSEIMVFSLGQNVSHVDPNSKVDALLLRALARLKLTAALPGRGEEFFYRKASSKKTDISYVLSNRNVKVKTPFSSQPFLLKEGVLIVGFYYESASKAWVNGHVPTFVQFVQKMQRKWKPRRTVVLVRTDKKRVNEIQESNLFSEVISGNTRPYGSIADQVEKEDESLLQLQDGVWMVPLGGQGVLRGGQAIGKEAPSLAELLGDNGRAGDFLAEDASIKTAILNSNPIPSRVTWLDKKNYEFKSDLADLYAEHFKLQRAEYFSRAEKRKADIQSSSFVGSHECSQCHASAYNTWNETKHAKAYATLVKDEAHYNPDCVGCHVVGYDKKGGFVSDELSGHLKNVQCESCHGPRKEHISNPSKNTGPKATSDTCKQCHVGSHSPKFDFNLYWPKIRHGMK